LATPLAEAIIRIGADDGPLRSQLSVARGYVREQANILAGMMASIGVGFATKQAMEWEKSLLTIKGMIFGDYKQGTQDLENAMEALRQKTVDLGTTTMFSATEAAQAMKEFIQLGFDAKQTWEAIPDILNLAAAGNLKLADAAMFAGQTMRQFNLEATEIARVADVLSYTAAATASDVNQVALALSYAGSEGHKAGYSLEETTAALGVLANAGERGSRAGTSLRLVLTQLAGLAAKGKLKEWGIEVLDASNNLKPLGDIVDEFNQKLGHLSRAGQQAVLTDLFTIRGGTAMLKLMSQGGKAVRDLAVETEKHNGFAKQNREILEEGMAGAFRKMRAAGLTALGDLGSRFEFLRGVMTSVAELGKRFSNLSSSAKNTIAGLIQLTVAFVGIRVVLPRIIGLLGILSGVIEKPFAIGYAAVTKFVSGLMGVGQAVYTAVAGTISFISSMTAASVAMAALGATTVVVTGGLALLAAAIGVVVGLLAVGLVGALAAVSAGFVGAWYDSGDIGKEMKATWEDLKKTLYEIGAAIKMNLGGGAWTTLKQTALETFKSLVNWIKQNKDAIIEFGRGVLTAVGGIGNMFVDFVKNVRELAMVYVPLAIAKFQEWWAVGVNLFTQIKGWITENGAAIKEYFVNAVQLAINVVTNLWTQAKGTFENIKTLVGGLAELVGPQIAGFVAPIAGAFDWLYSNFSKVTEFFAYITNDFQLTSELIKLYVLKAFQSIIDALIGSKEFFVTNGSLMVEVLADAFGALAENAINTFKKITAAALATTWTIKEQARRWASPFENKMDQDEFGKFYRSKLGFIENDLGVTKMRDIGKEAADKFNKGFDTNFFKEKNKSPYQKYLDQQIKDTQTKMDELHRINREKAVKVVDGVTGVFAGMNLGKYFVPGAEATGSNSFLDKAARMAQQANQAPPGGKGNQANAEEEDGTDFPTKSLKIEHVGIADLHKKIQEGMQAGFEINHQKKMAIDIKFIAGEAPKQTQHLDEIKEGLKNLAKGNAATFG
jgi:TP901 family phage tail tape measure protein